MSPFDADLHAERRRPFERIEGQLVRLQIAADDPTCDRDVDRLRYVLGFARIMAVRNPDGVDVELADTLAAHARFVQTRLVPALQDGTTLPGLLHGLDTLVQRTREARAALLDSGTVARDALEAEVTTRLLAVVSGGGGGAGYVYPGAYEVLERSGLVPDLMVGTSVGSLMSLFRAVRRSYTFTPLVAAARRLSWGGVLRVLETKNRYGMPATFRLRLRAAVGDLFRRPDGSPLLLRDTEIPLVVVATGLLVEALKHDADYRELLLDDDVGRSGLRGRLSGSLKALRVVRELLARPDALRCIALGRDEGTEEFDALDAIGFSSAVPGVLHYDVGEDDVRMRRLLDRLYSADGITRLGEGGLTSNVPARIAWETVASGRYGRRTAFVLALDSFAPNPRRIGWYPVQQAVRAANVEGDRAFADLYVPFLRTLSPMNLVPSIRDAMEAVRWGRDAVRPHMVFARAMCAPVPVLD